MINYAMFAFAAVFIYDNKKYISNIFEPDCFMMQVIARKLINGMLKWLYNNNYSEM